MSVTRSHYCMAAFSKQLVKTVLFFSRVCYVVYIV